MHGKYSSYERARPQPAGHPPQDQEQKACRGGVQQHIGQMVSPSPKAIQLAVEHGREPAQRDPVVGMKLGKRPDDPRRREPTGNVSILVHKIIVIEVDEFVPDRLAEHEHGPQQQESADRQRLKPVVAEGGDSPAAHARRQCARCGRKAQGSSSVRQLPAAANGPRNKHPQQ